MLEITLIQPFRPKRTGAIAEENWQLTRPFSLFYLAAAIRKYTGYQVQVVDLETRTYKDASINQIFKDNNSRIFGITASTYTRFEAIKLSKILKKLHPDCCIVAGGVHFTYCAEETLQDVLEIDIVVRGEGEAIFVELSDAVNSGASLSTVKGISYREENQIFNNPDHTSPVNVDDLEVYDQYSWDIYPEYLYGYQKRIKAISVMSSRGCPYKCIFCAKRSSGYRVRNVKSVVDELEMLIEKFSIKAINFIDLTLTAKPDHIEALCQEIIRRKLDILWWCESRANMPLDLLDIMKEAGCVACALGVESGSPMVLSRIRKNITTSQVKAFCKKCHDIGIKVQCYFMYSHPEETKEDVETTFNFMLELEDYASCFIQPAMIFPGSELEKIAREKGILSKNFRWSEPFDSTLNQEFGQLSNCPLYIDTLPIDYMREVQSKSKKIKYERRIHKELSYFSLRGILVNAYKYLLVERRPLPDYVNLSFLTKFIFGRIFKKKASGQL